MANRRGRVLILGQNSLHNQLLRNLIADHAGFDCTLREAWSVPKGAEIPHIVLIDTPQGPIDPLHALLEGIAALEAPPAVAFINSSDDDPLERYMRWGEVRGIFHRETAPEEIVRGLEAMLAGEYWFPRKLLNAYLDRTREQGAGELEAERLTPRERQVLAWLVDGASNALIAERLHVTQHTVKSHLYRLFRKINVDNRVQAALWARKHLTGRGPRG